MKYVKIDELQAKLRLRLDEQRFFHSLGVMHSSIGIAHKTNLNTTKAAIAGLLHDCDRNQPDESLLQKINEHQIPIPQDLLAYSYAYHCYTGAWTAEHEFGITDPDILAAIRTHSTGDQSMSALQKVLYIADYIEPTRPWSPEGIRDILQLAYSDLQQCFLQTAKHKLEYHENKGKQSNPLTERMKLEYLENQTGG